MRLRARLLLLVFLGLGCGIAVSQPLVQPPPPQPIAVEQESDAGFFEVRSAIAELRDGVYYLNAVIAYRLSTEAVDALHSGVPLGLKLDVEIVHPRRWWFDDDSVALLQSNQLEYHEIGRAHV